MLTAWRKQRDAGALEGLDRKRGRKPADRRDAENAALRRRLERAEAELGEGAHGDRDAGKRLRASGRDARAQGAKPELLAERPNEVYSWDITKLLGPAKWTYFYLLRHPRRLQPLRRRLDGRPPRAAPTLAEALIAETLAKQGRSRPGQLTLHADRGSSMTSKPVAFLLADLGVTKTHSRPHISNDNPYSEAQFKTLKYRPGFPRPLRLHRGGPRVLPDFFRWYNTEHRHSGIGLLTPAIVHYGQAQDAHAERARVLAAAYARHSRALRPRAPTPPAPAPDRGLDQQAQHRRGLAPRDSRDRLTERHGAMRKLIYGMNLTLDGYIAAPGDDLGWSGPSDELFQWWLDQELAIGLLLYGRKLWETMSSYWPTGDQQPDATPAQIEFARNWRDTPKVVFSSTIDKVDWNTRLVTGDAVAEITRLKAEDGEPMRVGGAALAGAAMRAGLVDEYEIVTHPVLVGGGTPFFTALDSWVNLNLVETRTFPGGVVLTRYETRR